MFKKIIVGVDFTPKSDRAVEVAINLAKAVDGTAVLVHVAPIVTDAQHVTAGSDDEVTRSIEQRLREESARLSSAHSARVDYGALHGSPAAEIVAYVERWGGDVIVCGSERRSGLGRVLVGSVAERLISSSPVPVLVVGPKAQ